MILYAHALCINQSFSIIPSCNCNLPPLLMHTFPRAAAFFAYTLLTSSSSCSSSSPFFNHDVDHTSSPRFLPPHPFVDVFCVHSVFLALFAVLLLPLLSSSTPLVLELRNLIPIPLYTFLCRHPPLCPFFPSSKGTATMSCLDSHLMFDCAIDNKKQKKKKWRCVDRCSLTSSELSQTNPPGVELKI